MTQTIYCLSFLLFISGPIHAKVHDFETARLKSTAGSGVGSVLMNEAAILNPASISFFSFTSIYLQKHDLKLKGSGEANKITSQYGKKSDGLGVILADGKNAAKGALSYTIQQEGPYKRKRFSAGLGSMASKTSAVGAGYRYTVDEDILLPTEKSKNKYHQFTMGAMHALGESLTVGLLYVDPLGKTPEDSRGYVGGQYFLKRFIALIGDVGADYRRGLSDTLVYRAALQLSFFKDFFVRAGLFDDKAMGERGNGIGISWVGPKLNIDVAMKTTKPNGSSVTTGTLAQKTQETIFGLSYRF
ncbi:MAG: hypothetical protein HOE90_01310 [Bacteriovoracaceae bacterium]|nr:hypothetical protein [Bacteriovoracaceae bacterium]